MKKFLLLTVAIILTVLVTSVAGSYTSDPWSVSRRQSQQRGRVGEGQERLQQFGTAAAVSGGRQRRMNSSEYKKRGSLSKEIKFESTDNALSDAALTGRSAGMARLLVPEVARSSSNRRNTTVHNRPPPYSGPNHRVRTAGTDGNPTQLDNPPEYYLGDYDIGNLALQSNADESFPPAYDSFQYEDSRRLAPVGPQRTSTPAQSLGLIQQPHYPLPGGGGNRASSRFGHRDPNRNLP